MTGCWIRPETWMHHRGTAAQRIGFHLRASVPLWCIHFLETVEADDIGSSQRAIVNPNVVK